MSTWSTKSNAPSKADAHRILCEGERAGAIEWRARENVVFIVHCRALYSTQYYDGSQSTILLNKSLFNETHTHTNSLLHTHTHRRTCKTHNHNQMETLDPSAVHILHTHRLVICQFRFRPKPFYWLKFHFCVQLKPKPLEFSKSLHFVQPANGWLSVCGCNCAVCASVLNAACLTGR